MKKLKTEDAWKTFERTMQEQSESHIPKSKRKRHRLYINREVERKTKKKYHLWKRFVQTDCGRDHEEY